MENGKRTSCTVKKTVNKRTLLISCQVVIHIILDKIKDFLNRIPDQTLGKYFFINLENKKKRKASPPIELRSTSKAKVVTTIYRKYDLFYHDFITQLL